MRALECHSGSHDMRRLSLNSQTALNTYQYVCFSYVLALLVVASLLLTRLLLLLLRLLRVFVFVAVVVVVFSFAILHAVSCVCAATVLMYPGDRTMSDERKKTEKQTGKRENKLEKVSTRSTLPSCCLPAST